MELESFSKEIDEDEKKLALSLEALSLFPKLEKNRSAKTAAQDAKNAEIAKSEAEKNAKKVEMAMFYQEIAVTLQSLFTYLRPASIECLLSLSRITKL